MMRLPVLISLLFVVGSVAARPFGYPSSYSPVIPETGRVVSLLGSSFMDLTNEGAAYSFKGVSQFSPMKILSLGLEVPFFYAEDTKIASIADLLIFSIFPLVKSRYFLLSLYAGLELPSGDKRLFRYYTFKGNSICIETQHQYDSGTTDLIGSLIWTFLLPYHFEMNYNIGYESTGNCKCFPEVLGDYDDKLFYSVTLARLFFSGETLIASIGLDGQWQDRWGERLEITPGVSYEFKKSHALVGSFAWALNEDFLQYYRYRLTIGYSWYW